MVSPAVVPASKEASSSDLRSKPSPGGAASEVSIRLWPPGARTRSHVVNRMAENLKSLSTFYQPVEPQEAARVAALVEERAFEEGEREDQEVSGVSGSGRNNGSSAVRIYAKQASRMMLEVLKTGKLPEKEKEKAEEAQTAIDGTGQEKDASSVTTAVKEVMEDTGDSASTPPLATKVDPQLFDISGGSRDVLDREKAEEVFQPLVDPDHGFTKVRLSNRAFTKEAAEFAGRLLSRCKERLVGADLSDIVAGRPEPEALDVMSIFSAALEGSDLRFLYLSNNALGEKGVRAFGSLLKSQKHLEDLRFENNGISSDAAKAIVELVSGSKLRTLHFHNNMSGDLGAERIASLVRQATALEDFKLSSSRVGTKGAVALAEALQACSSLKKLDLRDNIFGEEGGFALGKAFRTQPLLEELYLSDLGLQNAGVQAVLEALETTAPKLSVLDLGNNDISTSCAPHLVRFLEKKAALKKLSLAENELKDKGVILVSNALRQGHDDLEELDFTLNDVGSDGAIAAAKAVTTKPRFKLLILESNHISAKGLASVRSVLASGVGTSVLAPLEDNELGDEEDEAEEIDENDGPNEEVGDTDELESRVGAVTI
ncbi:RAN GTPase-activating protein 1 [Selaginella moellendorffii]|uniref:RAN GTPase-activating protein 1 n=1 Tax=Selaginella moellendorffii TaxID=88036 RepID=UPI000D1C9928|nr:RAN GTPase-activating protein 1 [Selaginella moellendorffii]|eukprot:XP_024538252.1 RAN GTPase-activating protein 1 [Selaginella moellendorffii]